MPGMRGHDMVIGSRKQNREVLVVVVGSNRRRKSRRRTIGRTAQAHRLARRRHRPRILHGKAAPHHHEHVRRHSRNHSGAEAAAAAYCVQRPTRTMVDHELDELKREFLAEAEEKVREMATALAAGRDPEALERVGYLAHQLKGSGGSYGYQRISADAAEIEKTVESVNDGGLDSGAQKKIQEHVGNLRAEIESRVRELGAA